MADHQQARLRPTCPPARQEAAGRTRCTPLWSGQPSSVVQYTWVCHSVTWQAVSVSGVQHITSFLCVPGIQNRQRRPEKIRGPHRWNWSQVAHETSSIHRVRASWWAAATDSCQVMIKPTLSCEASCNDQLEMQLLWVTFFSNLFQLRKLLRQRVSDLLSVWTTFYRSNSLILER